MLKFSPGQKSLLAISFPFTVINRFCSEFSQIQRSKPDLLFLEFSGFVYYSVFNFKGTMEALLPTAEGGI